MSALPLTARQRLVSPALDAIRAVPPSPSPIVPVTGEQWDGAVRDAGLVSIPEPAHSTVLATARAVLGAALANDARQLRTAASALAERNRLGARPVVPRRARSRQRRRPPAARSVDGSPALLMFLGWQRPGVTPELVHPLDKLRSSRARCTRRPHSSAFRRSRVDHRVRQSRAQGGGRCRA